ncbi:MAG: hypothetical protein A2W99_09815 [Bacteroidetes bacterium GWF2_33_16]|nr:MAG: hypothetical protein A2X00_06725 [Bacteroidetes bacterium GWE2_32_14]OFY07289.1 MAG: hypothetical protein A2W99_09815 [Bacteroidetes bacterium GWF2_33_16]
MKTRIFIISFLSIILTLIFSIKSFGQELKEFSTDTTLFIEQFESFVKKNISDSDKENLDQFVLKWKTNIIDEKIQFRFIDVCNLLLKEKAQRSPHFTKYLEVVTAFFTNENAMKNYDDWEKGVLFILSGQKYPLGQLIIYIDHTLDLITSGNLYKSYATAWYVSSNNYKIIVDETIKITFEETNLICRIKNDSINIYNSKGVYYPLINIWNGQNGTVTWERAGYSADSISARLNKYQINLTRSGYDADSAVFTNKIYFDAPILGKLSDQVVHIMSQDKAIYPEFNSYQKRFQIKNIYPDIDYDGGFSMKGANLMGSGIKDQEAYLFIHKHEKIEFRARSESFMFKKDRVISNNAQVTIKLSNDSIYHPGLMFTYVTKTTEVTLNPTERVVSKSPFFDSYHNLFMKFDRLIWNTNTDKIYLTSARGSAIGNATFTSSNFYNLLDYDNLQSRDNENPLILIRNFAKMKKSDQFKAEDFANYMIYPIHQVRQMLMFISMDGFIFFDVDNDIVTINQRLYDYINSRLGKIDYDVIKFFSQTEGQTHNAIYDITTSDLEINGVPRIFLSDSQNVAIYPQGNRIIMKKNRSFSFGGIINAGLFTFHGKVFHFDYDTFKIALNNVDSLTIKVQTTGYDLYGKSLLAAVQNTIKLISGNLLIDNPENKSGLKNFPEYPIFISEENSFVYYNVNNAQGSVYKPENFFFKLDPFVIDSLDNFTTKGLRFDGEFFSAGIFPPFEDAIYMRPDYSLGFNRLTPPEGFPLYEGKGMYFNEIDLSNQGLKGNGTLEYLTSKSTSDSITFYPDSTKIHAQDFTIAQRNTGIEFPYSSGNNINIKWYPYKDVMFADQTKDPFKIYNQNFLFYGALKLQPIGLTGKGKIDLDKAILESNLFFFDALAFNSDTTSFKLKSIDKTDFNMLSTNLNAKVNLTNQLGNFKSNDSFTIAEFTKNLYKSYLDEFDWKINLDEIHINSNPQGDTITSPEIKQLSRLKDGNLPGALFLSIHRSQDSLRFASSKAIYKLADNTINATEVEYIKVADASVYPKDGDVTVGKLAEMSTLNKSLVIANDQTKYHTIFNSRINIRSRNNYTGSGEYNYIDESKKTQIVHFSDIHVDTTKQTIAIGKIIDTDNFTLSPVYAFQGEVQLNAARKYLTFRGGVRISHECEKISQELAIFETEINPDTIYIPISDNTKSLLGRGLFAASFITKDSSHIYSSFLTRRRDPNDEAIVKATGYLFYNKNSNKYIIADKSKILNPDTTGSLVNLHQKYCLQHGEGKINLGIELGQINLSPAGSFNHDLIKNEIKLDLILPIDFFFSEAALDTMIKDIQSQRIESFSITSDFFTKNMYERFGETNTNEFKNQSLLFATEAKLPKDCQHTLFLSELKLKWYTEGGMYLSYGKIGISTINNKPVNKYVDGYFQILKRRSGDLMKFYFKLPNNNYYYFTYSRGVMQTLSNNTDFVNAIQSIKNSNRKQKTPRNQTPYRYIIATEQNLQQFLRDLRLFEEAQNAKNTDSNLEQPQFEEPLDSIQFEEEPTDSLQIDNEQNNNNDGFMD